MWPVHALMRYKKIEYDTIEMSMNVWYSTRCAGGSHVVEPHVRDTCSGTRELTRCTMAPTLRVNAASPSEAI